MKRALMAGAVLASFATPASAATVVWQGDMFVTAVNNPTACSTVNVSVGDFARGIFRPKNVATNGTTDLLSFVHSRSAFQIVASTPAGGSLNGATAATARYIFGSAGFTQLTGNAVTATVTPPTLTTTTPTVAITITINNVFTGNVASPSGCNATYKGTLAKRP